MLVSGVQQSDCVCVCVYFFSFSDSFLKIGYYKILIIVPVLSSRHLLIIYFIYGGVSMLGLPRWLSGKESASQCKEMQEFSPSREDPLEEEMATHSSILAWRISWTEEPDALQSIGSQRVRHD